MTILSPAPTQQQYSLTAFDVLDAVEALHNVAYHRVGLDARDRQALAFLTYWDGLNSLYRKLLTRIAGGSQELPLSRPVAGRLLNLIDALPATTWADEDAWRNHHAEKAAAQPVDGPLDRAERIIAARAARHHDSVGDALKWALRVLVAEMAHAAPSPISDTEQYAAHEQANRLVEQAARDHQAAEHGEQTWKPADGDAVTWNSTDGMWIVRGYEDDDTVWIHRPDVRMVPMIGRNGGGMVDLAGWRDEPEHQELVAIAALRPAEQAAAVTR